MATTSKYDLRPVEVKEALTADHLLQFHSEAGFAMAIRTTVLFNPNDPFAFGMLLEHIPRFVEGYDSSSHASLVVLWSQTDR